MSALTGEIKLGDQEVVSWVAVYHSPMEEPGMALYHVLAKGYLLGSRFSRDFLIPHRRNDGPYVLSRNILVDLTVPE